MAINLLQRYRLGSIQESGKKGFCNFEVKKVEEPKSNPRVMQENFN